jgi:amino acid adenylation domain-containing protein
MITDVNTRLPADQQSILDRLFHPAGNWAKFTSEWLSRSLPERFEYQVTQHPNRIAMKIGDEQLNYAEFNQAANRVAHLLLARCGPGAEPIPLFFQHGVQTVVAMWGVLKAGKFYTPLDVNHPQERNGQIIHDLNATVLLTNQQNCSDATALCAEGVQLLSIEESIDYSSENPALFISPDAFAYVIFTSGSTGRPKGVIEDHQDVMNFSRYNVNTIHICPGDRLGIISSFSFNGVASSLYPALLSGAALYAFDLKQRGPAAMVDWLHKESITILTIMASAFRQCMTALTPGQIPQFPHLRHLRFGAEKMTLADWHLYRAHCPDPCILRHGLGTSEVKHGAAHFLTKETPPEINRVPAGYAIDGIEVLVLDEDHNPVLAGEVGEIAFKGRYMARGYWQRPELTAEKFLNDASEPSVRIYLTGDLGRMDADGLLYHLGRKDFQVKIRGYRIETNEIEAHLLAMEGVKDVVVVAQDDAQGEKRLVAYLVAKGSPAPTATQIRRYLEQRVPGYMIPAVYKFLDALPQTAVGKVDRLALPAIGGERPLLDTPYLAPSTPIEERVTQIWMGVLGLEQIGIYDPFLELGGDSLKAMQILAQAIDAFQVEITPSELFAAQTVAEMAQLIFRQQVQAVESAEIEQLLADLEHE